MCGHVTTEESSMLRLELTATALCQISMVGVPSHRQPISLIMRIITDEINS